MTPDLRREVPDHEQFSMAHGPLTRVARRLHLARADDSLRTRVIVAFTWVPLCLGALLRIAAGHPPQPILFDLSVHVRLLIGIPLLVLAEKLLDARCRSAISQLYDGNFAERSAVDQIIARAERLRDSRAVEIAILVAALLAGQASLWGLTGSTGMVSGVDDAGAMSVARVWYASVALPIVQFLLCRWLWHWLIWSYVVIDLSRLKLATIATHPDHAGGLGFLAGPISAFTTFVLATSALLASAWGTHMLTGRAALAAFVPSFVVFVIALVIVSCAPLLAYIGILYRARHREIHHYNELALDYVRAFDRKWIEARSTTATLLGTSDLQSLADLGNSYESLRRIRLIPVGPHAFLTLWVAAIVPMIPLAISTMPITELLQKIGRLMLGGL